MSGKLKHKVKLLSGGTTKDTFGNIIKATEQKVMEAKANVQVISGAERISQGTALDTEFISIMMRSDTRIKHDLTLLWNGNRYTIDNIRPDDKNMKVIVQASRELRNG